jgi:hypothetical protein
VSTQDSLPSRLMLEACFTAADDRFLDEWVRFSTPEFLAGFLERWLADPRPWARQLVILYLQRPLNMRGHEVVVKRLCRHFLAAGDHEMLAHLMVACDRFVRRIRVGRSRRNQVARDVIRKEQLFAMPDRTSHHETSPTAARSIGRHKHTVPPSDRLYRTENRLFSHRTRNYLRRSVWRYFRRLSYSDGKAYLAAMTSAVIQYRDDDFAAGENILDNWSLMHVCYFHSEVLRFSPAHANLQSGGSLADLFAAPYQPELWQHPGAAHHLLEIVMVARSTLARVWASELLQRNHREVTQGMPTEMLLQLLCHTDPRVQQFASNVFEQHQRLTNLPVTTWLGLLDQCSDALLPMICAAMTGHVSAAGLDTLQLVQLTSARPFPVSEFGFSLLTARHGERPLSVAELTALSRIRCEALAGEITTWALTILDSDLYQTDSVVEFFDAPSPATRSAAMDWLEQIASRGHNDPALWARLIETPFDDIQLRVVECLHRRSRLPGTETDALAPVWCAVILGVHRGGRTKLKAVRQLQTAILNCPARAAELIPVLAVAIRSLRAPERRSALAAVASIVVQNADLQAEIQRLLPELQWVEGS